jgi:hypothetical protein
VILTVTTDASGAREAAQRGQLVVVVDVIDMSTTAEAAWQAGALAVYGASPDDTASPVPGDPDWMARHAAKVAKEHKSSLVVAAEPRVGPESLQRQVASTVFSALDEEGIEPVVVGNLGSEVSRLVDFKGKVVLIVSATGGVAFEAASLAHPRGAEGVLTATIARAGKLRGSQAAQAGVQRAIGRADKNGIALVAASGQSLEDVLAAQYLYELLLERVRR